MNNNQIIGFLVFFAALYLLVMGFNAVDKKYDNIHVPMGRSIRLRLTNEIDQSSKSSPLVCVVDENYEYNEKIIIPAGTEVHSEISYDKNRGFIPSTQWKFINTKTNFEATIQGIMVDENNKPLENMLAETSKLGKGTFHLYTKSDFNVRIPKPELEN